MNYHELSMNGWRTKLLRQKNICIIGQCQLIDPEYSVRMPNIHVKGEKNHLFLFF